MSDTKFTPGPWEVRQDYIPSEHGTVEIYNQDNRWLASALGIHVGPETKEQAAANAKLIAAAPELLEALRLALPYVEGAYECAFPDSDQNENVLEAARAAIAKATD